MSGLRELRKLLLIGIGTAISWILASGLAIVVGIYFAKNQTITAIGWTLAGVAGGLLGSLLVSLLVQWNVGRRIDFRSLLFTGLMGAVAGSLLFLDNYYNWPNSKPLNAWICFMAWQPIVLLAIRWSVWKRLSPISQTLA